MLLSSDETRAIYLHLSELLRVVDLGLVNEQRHDQAKRAIPCTVH